MDFSGITTKATLQRLRQFGAVRLRRIARLPARARCGGLPAAFWVTQKTPCSILVNRKIRLGTDCSQPITVAIRSWAVSLVAWAQKYSLYPPDFQYWKCHKVPYGSHKLPPPCKTIQVKNIRRLFAGELNVQRDKYRNEPISEGSVSCMNIRTDNAKKHPISQCKFYRMFNYPAVDFNQKCDYPTLVGNNVGQLIGRNRQPDENYDLRTIGIMNVWRNKETIVSPLKRMKEWMNQFM